MTVFPMITRIITSITDWLRGRVHAFHVGSRALISCQITILLYQQKITNSSFRGMVNPTVPGGGVCATLSKFFFNSKKSTYRTKLILASKKSVTIQINFGKKNFQKVSLVRNFRQIKTSGRNIFLFKCKK